MWLDTIVAQFAFGLHNLEQIVRAYGFNKSNRTVKSLKVAIMGRAFVQVVHFGHIFMLSKAVSLKEN